MSLNIPHAYTVELLVSYSERELLGALCNSSRLIGARGELGAHLLVS
jgi:hypothetical protein